MFTKLLLLINNLGERDIEFDDLTIDEPGMDYTVLVTCQSNDWDSDLSATSPSFHVHSFPDTGLLSQSKIEFSYRGPYTTVTSLVASFDSSMGTMTCEGCPDSGSSRKKRGASRKSSSRKTINLEALRKVHFPSCLGKGSCEEFPEYDD